MNQSWSCYVAGYFVLFFDRGNSWFLEHWPCVAYAIPYEQSFIWKLSAEVREVKGGSQSHNLKRHDYYMRNQVLPHNVLTETPKLDREWLENS